MQISEGRYYTWHHDGTTQNMHITKQLDYWSPDKQDK